jgi:hypothetical protein
MPLARRHHGRRLGVSARVIQRALVDVGETERPFGCGSDDMQAAWDLAPDRRVLARCRGIPGRRALPGRRPAGPTGQGRPGFEAAWQAAASAADVRHENQAGMRNGRRFRIRALRSMPFRGSGLLRLQRRATGKLTTLRAGASSGRPAEGHRRRWRRVRARWPTRSSRA